MGKRLEYRGELNDAVVVDGKIRYIDWPSERPLVVSGTITSVVNGSMSIVGQVVFPSSGAGRAGAEAAVVAAQVAEARMRELESRLVHEKDARVREELSAATLTHQRSLASSSALVLEKSGTVERLLETTIEAEATLGVLKYNVRKEPMFVKQDAKTQRFLQEEMNMETVGRVFAETGDALGLRPYSSGLNSGRRNGIVGIAKGCDDQGRDQTNTKKAANHHGKSGTQIIDAFYDDATSSSDNGALLMGRQMERMESLRTLATTRLPELAKYRTFTDVPKEDPVRVRLFEEEPARLAARRLRALAKQVVAQLTEQVQASEGDERAKGQVQLEKAQRILSERRKKLDRLESRLRKVARRQDQEVGDVGGSHCQL